MHALIGFTVENNIYVKTDDFYVEMRKTIPMTDVLEVLEWNSSGYMVINTNYGEEYYEIQEYLKLSFSEKEISKLGLENPLSNVTNFKVKHKQTKSDYLDKVALTVDGIGLIVSSDKQDLLAVDLRNTKSKMSFKLSKDGDCVLSRHTFKDGKPKYEALYVAKCNESLIKEL